MSAVIVASIRAAVTLAVFVPTVRMLAPRIGAVDHPGPISAHTPPVPCVGAGVPVVSTDLPNLEAYSSLMWTKINQNYVVPVLREAFGL